VIQLCIRRSVWLHSSYNSSGPACNSSDGSASPVTFHIVIL